jgi:aspartate aminotransferase
VIRNDQDFCLYLLEKAFVSTVPGSAFGDGRCIRVSFSNKDEILMEAMQRIKKALALLS